MKMTKYSRIALAAVVSIGLAQSIAFAKNADDEDNSIHNWGPWDKMVTPAAGPTPVFVAQLPQGMNYQPPVNPNPPEPIPPPVEPEEPTGPEFRSYATYHRTVYTYPAPENGRNPANYDRQLANMSEIKPEFTEGTYLGQWTVDADQPNPNYPHVDSVEEMYGDYSTEIYGTDFDADGSDYIYGDGGEGYHSSEIYDARQLTQEEGGTTSGYWRDYKYFYNYITGNETETYDYSGGEGDAFVQGYTTPSNVIDQLNAGNVVATYSGLTMGDNISVNFVIDFGNKAWEANFGDMVGFNGVLTAVTEMRSENPIALGDFDSATGKMAASIVGDQAQRVIGGIDVEFKTGDRTVGGITDVYDIGKEQLNPEVY